MQLKEMMDEICSRWSLPKDYIEELEKMKTYDSDLYRVARLGRYGVNGTRVLPQFQVMPD